MQQMLADAATTIMVGQFWAYSSTMMNLVEISTKATEINSGETDKFIMYETSLQCFITGMNGLVVVELVAHVFMVGTNANAMNFEYVFTLLSRNTNADTG